MAHGHTTVYIIKSCASCTTRLACSRLPNYKKFYTHAPVTGGSKKPAVRKLRAKVDLDQEKGDKQSMHGCMGGDGVFSYRNMTQGVWCLKRISVDLYLFAILIQEILWHAPPSRSVPSKQMQSLILRSLGKVVS